MKKIVRTLVSVIVAFAALCGITACSDDEKECEHEWNSGKVTVEATCTEEGEMTYTCSLCGETKTEDIDALGHDFSGELVNTDAQGHYHKCTRCGETDTVEAHVMVDGEIITPATTEHEGAQRIYCSVCGYESIKTLPVLTDHRASDDWETDDTYHWRECAEHEDCGVIFDKGEHEYLTELVDQYVPATCEHDGYSVWQCVCGKSEQHVIPKDESLHEWDEGVVTVEATCGHAGVMTYTCTLCGETRTEDIPALEHIWDEGEVTTEATCGHAGVMTYTCTLCGETRTENIPALEHIFSDEWVNTDAEGHYHQCVSCGAIDEKIAHTLVLVQDEENNKHYWECSVCGYKGEPSDHEWGEGVITTPATLYSKGVRTYTCECGATKTEVIPAGASFAADFSIENQDGAWGYGAVEISDYDADKFTFEYTSATEKNADTWLINGAEIKAGWINAACPVAIVYNVENDIIADVSISFVGVDDGSRASLRLAVIRGGALAGDVQFAYDNGVNTAEMQRLVCLKAGDVVYLIVNPETDGTNSMGNLAVALSPATAEQQAHTAGDVTAHDGEYHWKQCSSHLYCTEQLDKAEHSFVWSKVDENTHKGVCECGYETVCAHEWNEGEVTAQPDCEHAGEITYTCTVCGATKIEVGEPATGHDYDDEWHYVKDDLTYHYHQCTVCGAYDEQSREEHDWVETERVEATPDAEGKIVYTCSLCGAIKEEVLYYEPHQPADDWSHDDTYHWHACTVHEGCTEQLNKAEHSFVWSKIDENTHKGVCECGYETVGNHDWDEDEVTVEATCGHAGEMTYTCTLCGAQKIEEIPALEHIWDEGEVTIEATCDHVGEMTYTCTLCSQTRTEVIPALEHEFAEEWVNTDAEGHYHKCVNCGAIDEKIAHTLVCVQDEENDKHYYECTVCGYKSEPSDHEWGEGVITTPATLYSDGVKTYTCECGATKTEAIPAGADFAADFSIENQDGAWSYGAANITNWDGNNFGFEFTPATDKNADTWLINSIEIKSGWVNANGMTVIAYKVESDIVADISVSFVGINDGSRVSLRLAVFNADGKQCMPVEFIYDESSSTASRNFTLSLLGGSTVYVFANGEGAGDNAMGGLTVHLTPATVAADFGDDFSTENQDGAWSYGKVDYQWGNPEDFTFIAASEKTEDGEGWKAGNVEIRSNYITFDEMSAIGYTAESSVTLKAYVVLEGVTDATRADLRVGIKNAEGVIRENPSFHNNVNGSALCVTVDITLNAGDTVYFIFSNGNGGTPEATPAGGLHISLVQTAA